MSALTSLKRSWSGNAHDLGEDGSDLSIAPVKSQRKAESSGIGASSSSSGSSSSDAHLSKQAHRSSGGHSKARHPSSSPAQIVEDWDPTPPERQTEVRRAMKWDDKARQLHASSSSTASNVFKPKLADSDDLDVPLSSYSGGQHKNLAGVRVSGLSRSFTRTPSREDAFASHIGNASGSTRADVKPPRDAAILSQIDNVAPKPFTKTSSSSSSSTASSSSLKPHAPASSEGAARRLPPGFLGSTGGQTSRPKFLTADKPKGTSRVSSADAEDSYKAVEASVPGMFRLSAQQLRVRKLVTEENKNVFFTGSAGTGKSVLLRDIIKLLKKKYEKRTDAVAVTASTGIAACNIGGVTLHSFAGIGIGNEPLEALIRKIKKNRKAIGRWARTQVLIIDEVSMVEPDLLDKLEKIACALRKSPKPFGGIQVVITGDFFQLPPVMKNETKFAFQAEMWDRVMEHKVNLTHVFRQKDETFVRMLNEMRMGKLSQDSINRFRALSREPHFDENVVPTQLFPHREDVDRANNGRIAALKVSGETYTAKDGGELPLEQREKVLSNFMAPAKIFLKIGAQVMLIKNMDETLVNGSIGKVVAFLDQTEYILARKMFSDLTDDGSIAALREQQAERRLRETSPVKGAISASGSNQGSARNTPEPGSSAAALEAKGLVKKASPLNNSGKWPLVRFTQPHGGYRTELMTPETWKNELPNGEIQASRQQIPLILAWAMSIHKSQGQTIPCCQIDLGKVFEKGQAYVALSRATSLEGLQVLNFDPRKVMAHPRVIEWSKSLATMTA